MWFAGGEERNLGRMVRLSHAVLTGCAAAFCCFGAFAQSASREPETSAPRAGQVTETLTFPKAGGGSTKMFVVMDDWRFDQGGTGMILPAGVAAVTSVVNGAVSVTMDGVTKTFNTGDYWSVPPGSKMMVTVHSPARDVILRTITGEKAP